MSLGTQLVGRCCRHPKQAAALLFVATRLMTGSLGFSRIGRLSQQRLGNVFNIAGEKVSLQNRSFFLNRQRGQQEAHWLSPEHPRRGVNSMTVSHTATGNTKALKLQAITTKTSSEMTTVDTNSHSGRSGIKDNDDGHISPTTNIRMLGQQHDSIQHNSVTSNLKTDTNLSKAAVRQSSHGEQRSVGHLTAGRNRDCGDFAFDTDNAQLQFFQPAVSGRDLCLMLDTVKTLTDTLTRANITFFLYSGTLLGSWRHHGLVPWDDDVDIVVDYRQQKYLRHVLSQLRPHFKYNNRPSVSWKFYSDDASKIPHIPWSWPFVDICFFDQNASHVSEHDLKLYPEYVYPREWIFPLRLRPFMGLLLPCPAKTRRVLEHTYDLEQCVVGSYNHRKEKAKQKNDVAQGSVPCDRLRPLYPFVQHQLLKGLQGCRESLVLNGSVLSHLDLEMSPC